MPILSVPPMPLGMNVVFCYAPGPMEVNSRCLLYIVMKCGQELGMMQWIISYTLIQKSVILRVLSQLRQDLEM